ncbi:MAG: hypothetical protein WCV85_04935 [Patescibacteria group bacterium]|jgi:hypothetical protein
MENSMTTPTIEVVDYDEPQWKEIDESRYAHVGDLTIKDFPEIQTGKKQVPFRELEFDHGPIDDEVLTKATEMKCRQPSRAEVETYIRKWYTSEQLAKNPRVGLIGPVVRRFGNPSRVYVYANEDGVKLRCSSADVPWAQRCCFVVVCNE